MMMMMMKKYLKSFAVSANKQYAIPMTVKII